MKPAFGFLLIAVIIACITITSVESKSRGSRSCVKTCDECKKECKDWGTSSISCTIKKPRTLSHFCSCTGLGTIAVCGGANQLTTSIYTFVPFIVALIYKIYIN